LAGKNERIEREQSCGVIIVARLSGQCRTIAANCDALALLVGLPAKNRRFFITSGSAVPVQHRDSLRNVRFCSLKANKDFQSSAKGGLCGQHS
jgi:hypothetical protein